MRIKINGSYFSYFEGFTQSSSLDAVAGKFSFVCRYDPANKDHQFLLKPLTYLPIVFEDDNGKVFFTGRIITHQFPITPSPELIQVSGYSDGGILEDCTLPVSSYPLESLNLSLTDIAGKALKIFGLKLVIYANVARACSLPFEKSVCGATDKIKDYLSKLAATRNVLLSHDSKGNVILFRPDTQAASKGFYDDSNTANMQPEVDGQNLHSEITAIRQPKDGDDTVESTSTIKNPLVKFYRPLTVTLGNGNQTDTLSAVKNAFAAELKSISIRFEIRGRWDDLAPGDIIEIQNRQRGIPVRARWMVTAVARHQNKSGQAMNISAVLPETFTGDTPKNIFG